MHRLIAFLLLALIPVMPAYAQDNSTFTIKVFGAEDIVAPTTPTLSATTTSQTQIDISWSASSDNFIVSGYVLYRDGLPIATTTLTSYQDASLVASTTYSYFVRAFDPSLNYSSSSNIVTLTTPDYPPVPVGEPGSGGTATKVVLNNLSIEAAERTALFKIETVLPARFEIRWGRSGSYELGYTVNDVFRSSYQTKLTGLEPGTVYQYEVIGYTPLGRATVLERGEFRTKSILDTLPPANVLGFSGRAEGIDVRLSWVPPQGEGFEVKIVRNHLGFPAHTQDGVVVYQGTGGSVLDEDALLSYSPVYYTAFVIDAFGNVSSGAVARVYALSDGGEQPPLPGDIADSFENEGVASTSPSVPPDVRMPLLEEIFVIQEDSSYTFQSGSVSLLSSRGFLLSIPVHAVAKNLKSIIASLTNPTNNKEAYSFLLRINKDGTAYEAVVPAVGLEGYSRLTVDIYDYEAKVVGTYKKTLEFTMDENAVEVPFFPDKIIMAMKTYGLPVVLVLGVGVLWWLFLLWRRHREDND